MTELEIMQRAQSYVEQLARGVNPLTGEDVPEGEVLQQVRISRCLFYVSDVLKEVIGNRGSIAAPKKGKSPPFFLTEQEQARLSPLPNVDGIASLAKHINQQLGRIEGGLSGAALANALEKNGMLERVPGEVEGKTRRVPTAMGRAMGLHTQTRTSSSGEYEAVLYDVSAQIHILENLREYLSLEDASESVI